MKLAKDARCLLSLLKKEGDELRQKMRAHFLINATFNFVVNDARNRLTHADSRLGLFVQKLFVRYVANSRQFDVYSASKRAPLALHCH